MIFKMAAMVAGDLGLPISRILAIFIYKSPRCFLPTFKTSGLSVQEKKRKIYFQDSIYGRHFGFPIGEILATLIYKSP